MASKWTGDPCVRTKIETHERSFLIQCTGDGVDVSGQYAMQFGPPPVYDKYRPVNFTSIYNISYDVKAAIKTKFWRWENLTDGPDARKIDISKTGIYSGERLLIHCCGLHSFHATGRTQRIGWANGTATYLPSLQKLKKIL